MATDPFTQLHSALEALLKASPCIKRAMGPGLQDRQFVAFNKNRSDSKSDPTDSASLPLIVLEPAGGPGNINTASNYVTLAYAFNVLVATGDMRANILHPLLWAVFATLAMARTSSTLTGLQWSGKGYVKHVEVTSAPVGIPNEETSPGAMGWTAVCAVEFQLGFSKPDIDSFVSEAA